jgi:hypothetical protein
MDRVGVTNAGKRKRTQAPHCASGTAHNRGEKISAAVLAQQTASLRAAKGRERTPAEWWAEYEQVVGKRATQPLVKTKREDAELRWVQQKMEF